MIGAKLRVDLGDFAHNLDVVRARVAPAELMLVIKDDAYGHGLERIVARAVAEGVRWLGSFDVHSAVRTRAMAGAGVRIFSWLTVGEDEISDALAADIDLGVGDAQFLEDIAMVARQRGTTARVHLKIDTGLRRNGIRPEEWSAIIQRAVALQQAGLVRVVGIWSHIAEASDEEDDDAREIFDRAIAEATAAGCVIEMRHLAASAAAFARPEFRYDMVRVAAFCYGIRSAGGSDANELGVRPIGSLVAPVTKVGQSSVTLGIGSLHGLTSVLATRSSFAVSEEAGPDGLAAVEQIEQTETVLTAWPQATLGDMVTIFGPGRVSATDLAEQVGTVGEELLVRLSPLVPRTYSD